MVCVRQKHELAQQCAVKEFQTRAKEKTMSDVPQEKEMMKQKLLYQQARLHCRGAPEMVLQTISVSRGTQKMIHLLPGEKA